MKPSVVLGLKILLVQDPLETYLDGIPTTASTQLGEDNGMGYLKRYKHLIFNDAHTDNLRTLSEFRCHQKPPVLLLGSTPKYHL